ncbi:MAG: cache domain-containing protein [Proteobacteria bacterium]|nr:cache domain-containing protein [Pseudomonadota bacterium]
MKSPIRLHFPIVVPVRIFIPVLLSMFLFVGTFFGYILPQIEENLMERKREMIHALSESAMSTIRYFAELVEKNGLTEEEAKLRAVDLLRNLRYGPDGKDYFWINDTYPRMIMHPYRPDLEGQDVSETQDSAGMKLFQAFLQEVKKKDGGGYVSYHWQWQDEPDRIFSKISFVQEYRPWHWIIGTGVYVEDVRAQIAAITTRMTFVFLGIVVVIAILSVYVVWQGGQAESNRREMEESLRASENKYRLLAETAREIIMLFDSDLRITYVNAAWRRISGYRPGEMRNILITDLIPSPERGLFLARLAEIDNDRVDDYLFETHIILQQERAIVVEATFAKMEQTGTSTTFLMAARDTTEKKKIEAQAKMHQEQLMQTNKMVALGTLVSGVAHEINNPISSVMLNIQVFEKFWQAVQPVLDQYHSENGGFEVGPMTYPQLRERMPKLLHFSMEGVERVKRIVGDLKEFSGQQPSDLRETVSLNEVVDKAIGLISSIIKKATNDFQVVYDENLPTLQGNSQRLVQVTINLVVNACQALIDPSQGICLTTGYMEESEEIYLEVRDAGQGMTPEVLVRIKDPFFTTKRDSSGTGLGLAISDTIVRNHGGWMDFTSVPQQGTVATMRLPRYSPDEVVGRMI